MAFNNAGSKLSDSEHSDSYITPRDDRFYTPRASARIGGSSSDGEWATPRDGAFVAAAWGSDSEFVTPRTDVPHWSGAGTSYHPHEHAAGGMHPYPAEAKTSGDYGSAEDKWAYAQHDAKGGYAHPDQHQHQYPQQPPSSQYAAQPQRPQQPGPYPHHHQPQQQYQPPPQQQRPPLHPSSYGDPYGRPSGSNPSSPTRAWAAGGQTFTWDDPQSRAAVPTTGTYGAPAMGAGGGGGMDEQTLDAVVEDVFSFSRHNRVEEVERLLDSGVPVNVRDHFGNTILAIACQNGHKRVLKAALRRGADINSRNYKGNTPLHFCFRYGYGDSLGQYLISKGADPSIRNNSNMTCYEGLGN